MNKNSSAATIDQLFNDEPGLLDSQWHYVSVSYGGKQMGLLVETDDEEMLEVESDRVGTLVLPYPSERSAGVRIHDADPSAVTSGPTGTRTDSAVHGR